MEIERARHEVSQSSAGGAPFLMTFGATLLVCALLWFVLPIEQAALAVMFQGGIALPIAFWLERRMAWGPMPRSNPLTTLSIQLAMSQIVAFPIVIAMYDLRPQLVPLAMASIAGAHFIPYAWLQRTSAYVWVGITVAAGALLIQILLGSRAFPYILMHMTASYWLGAALVYRAARRLTSQ